MRTMDLDQAKNNISSDEGDWDQETNHFGSNNELDEASVVIGLSKQGAKGSSYRIRNDPENPWQRPTVVDRRGIVEVRCRSREVIHGLLSPEGDEYATLLVYQLDLDTTKRSRRILRAEIEFEFSSDSRPGSLRVERLAPDGRVSLLPSEHHVSITQGAEASVEAPAGIVSAGMGLMWERTVSRTVTDEARVTGSTVCDPDDFGREIGARWILDENESTKSGVPRSLCCAILVARADEGIFQCNVQVKVKADWKSELGLQLFGSSSTDEPLLFDPNMAPTNKLRKEGYDTDNLAAINLDHFVDIRFQKHFKS